MERCQGTHVEGGNTWEEWDLLAEEQFFLDSDDLIYLGNNSQFSKQVDASVERTS